MRHLLELAFLYACVGAGLAFWLIARRGIAHAGDAALLLALWPIAAPFVLLGHDGTVGATDEPGSPLEDALASARGTPLAALLPDERMARELGRRLRAAAERISEIDRVLARPGFSEEQAMARCEALTAAGRDDLAATAGRRVSHIRALRALRDRFERELEQVDELVEQLRIQAELVRLAGAPETNVREVVDELVAHVDGLDEALANEVTWRVPGFS